MQKEVINLSEKNLSNVRKENDLSYIQAGISASEQSTAVKSVSLIDMLFDIIPKNLVDPFKGDNYHLWFSCKTSFCT